MTDSERPDSERSDSDKSDTDISVSEESDIEISDIETTESESDDDDNSVDRETSGSPTPPPQSVSIQDAIKQAPPAELKLLVLRLWANVQQSRPLIDTALRRPLGGSSEGGNLKRKASEVCKNCGQVYQVDNNKKGMCVFHPQEKEVDEESDVWADHDPDCHGDPDHPSIRNDPLYADGYIMGCCERAPYEPGCVVSRHKPKVNTPLAKRVRR